MARKALISVSDKTGVVEFAKGLVKNGYEILSTGGTLKVLKENGIEVEQVSDYTGFPEMLDGRVKTLHPKIHAGLLSLRDNEEHQRIMKEHNMEYIDIVAVNLYPFKETISKENVTLEEAIENIDIGGPTMIRSAAKNYKFVTVIVDPKDYSNVIAELNENNSETTAKTRFELAKKVYKHTAIYDTMITNYLSGLEKEENYPEILENKYEKAYDLRYGENPHQSAVFYKELDIEEDCAATAEILHGKQLSFNNIIDVDAAIEIVKEFERPAVAILKHTNPCGAALADDIVTAFRDALASDPVSAFGSIIAVNRKVEADLANELNSFFNEIIIAPEYSEEALEILKKKKNRRLLKVKDLKRKSSTSKYDYKKVVGGLLVQERDLKDITIDDLKVVTEKQPTKEELEELMFAWKICAKVKSNAILLCKGTKTVGVGAGQMSRVDSSEIAVKKAGEKAAGSVLASDAFFPFRDGVDAAADAGIKAIIQPGGSIRDEEVIQAANEKGIVMVFTGMRHFRH
ncbi:bifunctional phosphoribosylaminoimidazolecarboxamide formyltransferase/IMP cyclohydrolase [Haliovirga abyssi]|uniref:Bifunctional purine biosynthesis protein PurH n=1 Tax=Haliovirga abyssi TaxID=2996794 RepID=A0AAU9DDY0_9FUSO|nr:bifunctional phosphoribosylaminoimidazolecarboxamide formyltransferase/IMP cyclohydrolase [Haliovirga abyssi]BDU50552.1 bifunctional purine biosynthesis protein PurH [Haliovirga abyssi]